MVVMREKENQLFGSWKKEISDDSGAIFVTDGIVNEECWAAAPMKVLYLLKEVNGADSEWDERDYLDKYNEDPNYIKTHSPTINVLTQWQYGLTWDSSASWETVCNEAAKADIQSKLLSQICLVNIKKTAGGSIVDWSKFDVYFNNPVNRKNLNLQLEIYRPDVVICGGTAWHLSEIKGWNYNDWKQTSRGVRFYTDKGTIYIDFCHPNNRGPKNMIYFALIDALAEIRQGQR